MTPRREAAIDISSIDSQLRAIERNEGTGTLEIDSGVSLRVSSLSKPFSHKIGVTKAALMRYYTRILPVLQPHVQDRALVIEALPRRRWRSNVLSAERWSKGAERSPGPFSEVVSLARDVRNIIGQCGLSAAVKTSGASGIHLVIPLPSQVSFEKSARLALQISRVAVQQQPTRATMERSIKARPTGTIYVDALQNARGKSMAGAYSVRARAEATVSAPIRERELSARLRTASFTVSTMPPRCTTGRLVG